MKVRAKICGVRDIETLSAVRRAGASHVGFVFFAKSPRNVSIAETRGLAAQAEGLVRVGLFVDARFADDTTERTLLTFPDGTSLRL